MNAVEALKTAQKAGVHVTVDGGDLVLDADAPPPLSILNALRRHKAEITTLLSSDDETWDAADCRAFFEERAAILQYDGGLDRAEAERQAFETTIIHWMNTHPPESLDPDTCAACGHPIGEIGKDAIPVLTGGGEHVWLHHRCWLGWRRHRHNEAAQALADLGIGLPSRSAGCRP